MDINIMETTFIIIYFLIILIIGIFSQKKVDDNESYYLAGRGLGVILSGIGRFAAVASSFTYLGALGLGYSLGLPFMLSIAVGINLGFLLTLLFLSEIRESGALSVPDFLLKRFNNKSLHIIASLISIMVMIPHLTAQIRGAGVIGNMVIGVSAEWAMIISTIIFVIYVFMGGLWAVSWTDLFQGIMLVVFMVLPAIVAISTFGNDIVGMAIESSETFMTGALPMWSNLGMAVVMMGSVMVFPAFLFWSFATKSKKTLHRSLTLATFLGVIVFSTFLFLLATANIVAPDLDNPDEAFFAVIQALFSSKVLQGLMAVAVLSAVMSTTDSILLATSAIVSNDIWKQLRPKMSSSRLLFIGRVSTLLVAIFGLLIALFSPSLIGELTAEAAGGAGSAFLFPLILGIWWKRMNTPGAIAGVLGGYISFSILIVGEFLPPQTPVLIGIPISGLLCVVVSLLTSKPTKEQERFVDKLHS